MGILRNIEHGENPAQDAGGHDELDALFGEPETHDADVLLGAQPAREEEYANSMQGASGEIKFDSATVTNMGSNDGRGGVKARKMNGGENPMHESLVNRLGELYQEVKGRDITELAKLSPIPTIDNNSSFTVFLFRFLQSRFLHNSSNSINFLV